MKQLKKIGKNLSKTDQKKVLGGTWPECRTLGESCSTKRPSCCEGLMCLDNGNGNFTGNCIPF